MSYGVETQTIFDVLAHFTDGLATVIGLGADAGRSFAAARPKGPADAYDAGTQSWAGEGLLRYKVPLVHLPGEAHARAKSRNVRVLMDNVRGLCVKDQLPCTEQERGFWTQYRFLKYKMYFVPFAASYSVLYVAAKVCFKYLPVVVRGRLAPFMLAGAVAEQYVEVNYPAHEFLTQALTARTPLGDAARAEWQRVQPVGISFMQFNGYQWRLMMGEPEPGFQFGGDITAVLK